MIPWWSRKENAIVALWLGLGLAFFGWMTTCAALNWREMLTPGPIAGLGLIVVSSIAQWFTNGGNLSNDSHINGAALRRLRRLQRAHNLTDEQLEEIVGGKLEEFPASAEDLLARQIEGPK